jgi:hypothetical protein
VDVYVHLAVGGLTGLAQESDIDRIHSNEQNIIASEQILSNKIIQIQAQSKAILTSLKDQSTKISSLYNDELAIKKALKDLLADTSNTMNQLNMVVTSIEILSDISIEVNAIFATIDLLPQLVNELHDALLAISTQALTEKIVPAEDISAKIPIHRRESIQSCKIMPTIEADAFKLYIYIPEYYNAFQLQHIRTIPYSQSQGDNYNTLNIESDTVASNNQRETFLYNANYCTVQNTVTICDSQMITVHSVPVTCAEALATNNERFFSLP